MYNTQKWADEVNRHEIESGDTITLETESEIDEWDGRVTLTVSEQFPGDYHISIDSDDSGVWVIPDPNSEGGASIVEDKLRPHGVKDRQHLAVVHGIVSVEAEQ